MSKSDENVTDRLSKAFGKKETKRVEKTKSNRHHSRSRKTQSAIVHKSGCLCEECRQKRKTAKREDSVIGVSGKRSSAPPSTESVSECMSLHAIKLEPENKLVFRCPHCNELLRMSITKKKAWDDSDSLLDAEDAWSQRRDKP